MSGYIFQRPESQNWYIRLYPPNGGKRLEKSLGTPDRRQAEILAMPYIAEHKRRLLEERPRVTLSPWVPDYEPGQIYEVLGERFFATERELHVFGPDNKVVERRPNGAQYPTLIRSAHGNEPAFTRADDQAFDDFYRQRQRAVVKDADSAILEDYLQYGSIKKKRPVTEPYKQGEARAVLALFKKLTSGKMLKDATCEDAQLLVDHYRGQKLKGASIQKKLKWLIAAINRAIAKGALKISVNPFSVVTPNTDDSLERHPFDDADMVAIRGRLDTLPASDQLLVKLLATTGMIVSEAFQIRGEAIKRACGIASSNQDREPQAPRPVPGGSAGISARQDREAII